ncbi:MAG: alanine--tRNA ligase, partial [Nannocystaceae bacterium]
GALRDLPKPSIDTGAGLERLAATVAGVRSNYETDLLAPLVQLSKSLAGCSGPQGDREAAFQVIADHARATAFLIADGVFPDRDGRAYVLRRIMRRAIRYGTRVGLEETFFPRVCTEVADLFSDAYPELQAARATIEEVVGAEEDSFRRTLSRGLKRLEVTIEELDPATKAFPIPVAAELYDTYGFPIDLTGVIAKEHGLALDEGAVSAEVKERQAGGEQRLAGGDAKVSDIYFSLEQRLGQAFVGYEHLDCSAAVTALFVNGEEVEEVRAGQTVEVVLDRTPLYAESGGQIGDEGALAWEEGGAAVIADCVKPAGALHIHRGVIEAGTLRVGTQVSVRVEGNRRDAIRRNHSATHLLHHALREVLGPHVIQKGSLVTQDRLRFDFSHNRPVTADELRAVEVLVNEEVCANAPSETREMGLDAAKEAGAIGLFGEKYGEEVRVVSIGRSSVELCGGTHVRHAGEIGMLCVVSETGIAQGVRRVEAVTGAGAMQYMQTMRSHLDEAGAMTHASGGAEVVDRIEKLLQDLKGKDQEISALQRKLATGGGGDESVIEVEGIKVLARAVPGADAKSLREAADTLRDRLKTGVVVLAGERDEKAMLLVAVTSDLKGKLHAGKLVGSLAAHVDGRGGGRPDLAQAGGPNVAGIPAALEAAAGAVREQLAP